MTPSLPESKAHTPDSWAAQIDDEKSFTKTRIAQHINDLCAKTNRHLDINVIVECEEKAGHYLVHLADELKPDVILVGSKERKGLIKGLFKENVGRYVAKHADAAVVAVKDLEHPLNAAGTDTGGVGVWGATGLPAPIGHNVDEVVKLGETHPVVHEQHHHQHPIDPKIPGANAWVAPGHVTPDAPTNAGINAKIVM